MKKINFVNGTTIDGAKTFNEMQDNVENVFNGNEPMGSIVVEDIKCKNLFNINNSPVDAFSIIPTVTNDTLTLVCNGEWSLIRYKIMPVEIGKSYTLSFNSSNPSGNNVWVSIQKTDKTTKYIEMPIENDGFTQMTFVPTESEVIIMFTPNNTPTFNTNTVIFSNIQLEKGTVATNYVPHKEFSNKQIYSTNEQIIGTYENGKTLYRKIIRGTSTIVDTDITIPHGIANIDEIMFGPDCYIRAGSNIFGISRASNDTKLQIRTNINNLEVSIYVGSWLQTTGYSYRFVLDYTKTTD